MGFNCVWVREEGRYGECCGRDAEAVGGGRGRSIHDGEVRG